MLHSRSLTPPRAAVAASSRRATAKQLGARRRPRGLVILVVFFGGFGAWAVTAPLNGAVVGEAVVKVEGNRKSVQHLDGGIVKEMRVKEGDRVQAGDVLLVLDDTQMRAEFEILSQQQELLRATEARLIAELTNSKAITFPVALTERPSRMPRRPGRQQKSSTPARGARGEEQILASASPSCASRSPATRDREGFGKQHASVVDETDNLADS